MRSVGKDVGSTLVFGALDADAASGSGVAQPGNIPYVWQRAATGQYTYTIDSRIKVTAVHVTVDGSVAVSGGYSSIISGGFTINTFQNNTTPLNSPRAWTCYAIDKRT